MATTMYGLTIRCNRTTAKGKGCRNNATKRVRVASSAFDYTNVLCTRHAFAEVEKVHRGTWGQATWEMRDLDCRCGGDFDDTRCPDDCTLYNSDDAYARLFKVVA